MEIHQNQESFMEKQQIYIIDWCIIDENHETTFIKENIYEITGWKSDFILLPKQRNFDIIDKTKIQIYDQESKFDNDDSSVKNKNYIKINIIFKKYE